MIQFNDLSVEEFLQDYWQKKPLLIKNAIPLFHSLLSPNELAGLALEDEVESRLVIEDDSQEARWQLQKGPFSEETLSTLAKTHWTLLIQGADRLIPPISHLLEHFNFLPQWRVDDVMVSLASLHGSVGPHYDHYDVFLFQAEGQRRWQLSSENCREDNCLQDTELRIMKHFQVEQEYLLNPGDLLYIPPHIAHFGRSLSEHSISYSFGYRSYQAQELWDSYADYLSHHKSSSKLYTDPNWNELTGSSEIPKSAVLNAKALMQELLNDEQTLLRWFSSFATELDQGANELLSAPLNEQESATLQVFLESLKESKGLERDPCARIAYHYTEENTLHLTINGEATQTQGAYDALIRLVANQRVINTKELAPFLEASANQQFLYELWKQQFLQWR